MGLALPAGASGPEGGVSIAEVEDNRTEFQYPPITVANVTSVASVKHRNREFRGAKHVFWAQAECGLILPSLSSWEVVTKQAAVTVGGYMCKFCKGFWRAKRGGSRFLQILGRHRHQVTALQMVLDEPPEGLYNRWIQERVEVYKRVEPLAAPRDERLQLVGGRTNRLRFSSTNGLGEVSNTIWQIILANHDKDGLKIIQEVARKQVANN
eukprot:Skav236398  [mRNA]  locus=scaffold1702:44549:45178:- [translate_table: standard]